jgi:predicted acetylornithine/succinylornithine family transaminase
VSPAGNSLLHADRGAVLPTYARADLTVVRGEGCRVWDDERRSYLDFGAGIAVVGLGHRHPAVTEATHAQLDRLWHASNLYWTEPMLRLAGLLSDRVGGAQAFFCNSGAEANEAALKVARKATGRSRVVALDGGFHGRTYGALSATGQPGKWEGFGPLVPGFSFARPNDVESLEAAVSPGGELAAILLEPVLGEGGVVPLEEGFVRAASEIAREVGALLCVDEVQSGLGRTGTFFAYEQLGVEPDLVTLAKGLGNGLPIGALLVREGVADAIGPGDHGSTFGGNPVAAAAACAVVEAIDDALLENVVARGAQLEAGLAELSGVREVRGRGLLLAGLLDRDAAQVVDECRGRGLLVLTAGPDVLRLLPPLVVSEAEVVEALAVLREVLA